MVSVRDIAMEHWTKYGRNFFRWVKAASCVVLRKVLVMNPEAMNLTTMKYETTTELKQSV